MFETAQVLFWTAFGEIHLNYFSLKDIRKTTELWGLLMYGSFCVISMVVLLNLLIAMMDHSYNKIFVSSRRNYLFIHFVISENKKIKMKLQVFSYRTLHEQNIEFILMCKVIMKKHF